MNSTEATPLLPIPRRSATGGVRHAKFSPDGKRIVAECFREGPLGRYMSTVCTFNPDGTGKKLLFRSNTRDRAIPTGDRGRGGDRRRPGGLLSESALAAAAAAP